MHVHGQKNRSIVTQCPWRDGRGGGGGGGSQAPSLPLILEQTQWVQSENFFIHRCSKDVPTNTKFVWNNNNDNSSHHWEEKPIWCLAGPPPPTVGHQRVKMSAFRSFNFVHFSNQLKLTQKNVNPLNFTRNEECVHPFWFHLNVDVV